MNGPFETEDQARQLPAVRAVWAAFRADSGPGKMTPHNYRLMADATEAAGIALGAYDQRILRWLAGFEPQTCAVIAGMIRRAAGAGTVVPGPAVDPRIEQLSVADLLEDADAYFVVTEALGEFAAQQRSEAEDGDANAERRVQWADRAESLLDQIEKALSLAATMPRMLAEIEAIGQRASQVDP